MPRRSVVGVLLAALAGSAVLAQPPPSATTTQGDPAFQQKSERLERVVYRNPRPGTAFDLWFQLYQDAGLQERLLQQTQQVCQADSQNHRVHLVHGLVCERLGQTDEALAAYRTARDLDGQQQLTRLLLGTLLQQQQQWEMAAAELSAGLPLTAPRPDQLQLAKQLAIVYQRLGKPELALDVWQQIATRFSRDVRVLTELATRLQHDGQIDAALPLWQTVRPLVADDPVQRVQVDTQLAELHLQQDQPSQALELLRPLLDQVQSDNWQAEHLRRLVEQAILAEHDGEELVKFWQEQLQARPDDLSAHVQLAHALARVNRVADAQREFESVLQRAPTRRDLRQNYIELLRRQGEFNGALQQAEELTQAFPQDTDVWLQLGQLHLQVSDTEPAKAQAQAVAAWRQMTALRPDDALLALQAANACRDAVEGRSAEADRGSAEEQLASGLQQANDRLLRAAEQFCRDAIRRNPMAAEPHEALGELLHWLNRPQEAVAAWSELAGAETAAAWHETARILARHGYVDQAIPLAKKAAEADPARLEYTRHWIDLLLQAGLGPQALSAATPLVGQPRTGREEETAVQLYVNAVVAAGQVDREIARLERPIQDLGAGRAAWIRGLLLAARGDKPSAAQSLRDALQQRPDDPRLIRCYARLLQQAGANAASVSQYQRLLVLEPQRRRDDYRRIVELELRQQNVAAAQQAAEQLVRLVPDDPVAMQLQATVALRAGTPAQHLAALQQAVQAAPRDLPLRRQLVGAWREAGQLDEALEEAFRCFQLADSLPEKQSVLAWILDWARDPRQREWLLAKVQQAQQRESDSYELTRCLADLLGQLNRQDAALQQLQQLQRRRPTDVELLRAVVDVAEASRQLPTALQYQEMLVERDHSLAERERLARLLRQAGRREEALRVWDELLQQDLTEGELLSLVDGLLQRPDLFQAQRFVEWGLARSPGNWRLGYRSALLHLALKQPDAARAALISVLTLQLAGEPSSHAEVAQSRDLATVVEEDLLRTLAAWQQWHDLRVQVERSGASSLQSLNRFFRSPMLDAAGDHSLLGTQLYSAVGLLTWFSSTGDPQLWLDEIVQRDDIPLSLLRVTTLAAWVTHQNDAYGDLLRRLLLQAPDSALPHLLRIAKPPYRPTSLPPDDTHVLQQLDSSLSWLVAHTADLPRQLRNLSVAQLIYHPNRQAVLELSRRRATSAQRLEDLTPWSPVLRLMADHSTHQDLLQRAARLLPDSPGPTTAGDLQMLLEFAIDTDNVSVGEPSAALLKLLEAYLSLSAAGSPSAGGPVSPVAGPSDRSSAELLSRLRRRAQTELDQAAQRRSDAGSSAEQRQWDREVAHARQQQNVLRGAITGEFFIDGQLRLTRPTLTSTDHDDRPRAVRFPQPGAFLDQAQLTLLQRLCQQLMDAGHADSLITWLRHQSVDAPSAVRPTLQMAHIYALAWIGEPGAALASLRQLDSQLSAEPRIRLELVRLLLQQDRLPDSLQLLSGLRGTPQWNTQGVVLREALARRFSQLAFLRDCLGHTGVVHSLAFSPDGATLASASVDGTVRIWDVASGQLRASLPDHQNIVLAVAFDPRGDRLASAGYDRCIRLWRTNDWQPAGKLEGHSAAIRCLAFTPDSTHLVSGGDDQSIYAWNLAQLSQQRELQGHRDSILTLAFSPSGRQLASASSDRTTRIWDWASGETTATLAVPEGSAQELVYLHDDNHLLIGQDQPALDTWRRKNGDWTATPFDLFSSPRSLAFSPNDTLLAVGCEDHGVLLWDLQQAQEQMVLRGHTGRVLSVTFSPNGQLLASAGFDGLIKLWQVHPTVEPAEQSAPVIPTGSVRHRPTSTTQGVRSWDGLATPARPIPAPKSARVAR